MVEYIDRRIARARYQKLARTISSRRDPLSVEVGTRQLESLLPINIPRGALLDLGCGVAPVPMLGQSVTQHVQVDWVNWPVSGRPDVVADATALPFADGTFMSVWSNLCLPWVGELPRALAEARRVLGDGGLLSFSTLGPDTLLELRQDLAGPTPRTLGFLDMHDLADMVMHAGFAEPVALREVLHFNYPNRERLCDELRDFGVLAACGMATSLGRPQELQAYRCRPGAVQMGFEVIYIHAWALPIRSPRGPAGWQQLEFQRRH